MPANWKTVLEFFNEFYHVQQTHHQLLPFTNDYSHSDGFGRHAAMWYPATGALPLSRSPRLPPKDEPEFRNFVLEFVETFNRDLQMGRGHVWTTVTNAHLVWRSLLGQKTYNGR